MPATPAAKGTFAQATHKPAPGAPATNNVPAILLWGILRQYNSFSKRGPGYHFNTEPGNLTNIDSFKYSGLAHAQVSFN
jgi:hypothetical protein